MKLNEDHTKELKEISNGALLRMEKKNVFQAPDGYFDSLPNQILQRILQQVPEFSIAAQQEIQELSPLLASLKKKPTLSTPAGYFDSLSNDMINRLSEAEHPVLAPVHTMPRNRLWIKYAAAATVIGFIGISAVFLINNKIIPVTSSQVASSGKENKGANGNDFLDVSDGSLAQFLSDTPSEKEQVVDSNDTNLYDVALLNMNDNDIAKIIHEIPDEDLMSYETDLQDQPHSL
jgi:hypothetical protein